MTEPARFTKRPIEIEAMQYVASDFDTANASRKALMEWGAPVMRADSLAFNDGINLALNLHVAKGNSVCRLNPGDWVIAEPDGGGFYPCAAEDFAATYQAPDVAIPGTGSEELLQARLLITDLRKDLDEATTLLAEFAEAGEKKDEPVEYVFANPFGAYEVRGTVTVDGSGCAVEITAVLPSAKAATK